MKNKHLIHIGLICLLAFYIFSRQVKQGFLKQTDFNTTVKIQEKIDTSSRLRLASFVGDVMEGSTFFASPEISVGVIILLTIFMMPKRKFRVLLIPFLFGLLVMGEIYGKQVVHHPAPPFFMIKNPTTIFPKYYINESFSYPSGHAARAVFIGIVLYSILKTKKRNIFIACGLLGYVLLISISRIYLGHHWLSDIIGGVFLGAGFGLLTLSLISPIIDKQ